ncbi:adenine phosphoribosyltransferase isoform X2 [Osmerus eperlanus]|uniref:adenine phosphoribosyltransferase isoform X2 n=1 Tax=Osmerus eperlanus TaxID=29151 RepID=UPI002E0E75CE
MDPLALPKDRNRGWYLSLMAPNTKGSNFAWLDPSRLYCNAQALSDCVQDLLCPFQNETIDLVAGIDAMGFILGSAVAATLGKGFLAIRKSGHLCIETQSQKYSDYSGREKLMEVRLDVLKPGVTAVAIENSEGGKWIKDHYKYSHCIPEELQSQIDEQYLDSFKSFKS